MRLSSKEVKLGRQINRICKDRLINRKKRKWGDRQAAVSLGITVSEWNRMDKVC